jgi:Rieske Fe-S protein
VVITMAKSYDLKPAPLNDEKAYAAGGASVVNRRQFLRYGFNATTGVLAASVGVLGFASILLPPGAGSGGDLAVKYWAKGREDEAWYGAKHLQSMTREDFVAEAAKSNTGTAGAAGVWNGVPVVVNYVDHDANNGTPTSSGKARYQSMEGYDETGKYVGHFDDMVDADPRIFPTGGLVMVFGRCTHLCCIPGWQLVSNTFTEDTWTPGGGDDGGTKLFCICHSSRFDPTALELNTNRNRANGATFTYAGIRRSGGPAPVGLPLIPIQLNGDTIEGITDYMGWLTYCD